MICSKRGRIRKQEYVYPRYVVHVTVPPAKFSTVDGARAVTCFSIYESRCFCSCSFIWSDGGGDSSIGWQLPELLNWINCELANSGVTSKLKEGWVLHFSFVISVETLRYEVNIDARTT